MLRYLQSIWHRLVCYPNIPPVLDHVWTCPRCGTKFIAQQVVYPEYPEPPAVEWIAIRKWHR